MRPYWGNIHYCKCVISIGVVFRTSTEAGKDEVVVKKMKSPAKPTPFKLNEEW